MSQSDDVLRSVMELKPILEALADERMRQITDEGYSLGHDADHFGGELAGAAASYAFCAAAQAAGMPGEVLATPPPIWPEDWGAHAWKPKDQRRNLIRAGALIIAELQRLERQAKG